MQDSMDNSMEKKKVNGSTSELWKVQSQLLEKYHCSYHAHQNSDYICFNSKENGDYAGHAFAINK